MPERRFRPLAQDKRRKNLRRAQSARGQPTISSSGGHVLIDAAHTLATVCAIFRLREVVVIEHVAMKHLRENFSP
jgi:hypothetical protein